MALPTTQKSVLGPKKSLKGQKTGKQGSKVVYPHCT